MTRFLFTQEPERIVLCPIVVGGTENRQPLQYLFPARGPLIPVSGPGIRTGYRDRLSGAVPRSSRPYRDERVLEQTPSGVTLRGPRRQVFVAGVEARKEGTGRIPRAVQME